MPFRPEAFTMAQPEAKRLNPLLRDAAISFVPQLTDDQLVRIARATPHSTRAPW
jgi:hypothetical protein